MPSNPLTGESLDYSVSALGRTRELLRPWAEGRCAVAPAPRPRQRTLRIPKRSFTMRARWSGGSRGTT